MPGGGTKVDQNGRGEGKGFELLVPLRKMPAAGATDIALKP